MDLVNTVKVSHIRATAAYKKALADFDAALPAMQAVADEKDARVKELHDKEMAAWRERTFGQSEKRTAWDKYDKSFAEWNTSGFFRARPAAPAMPDFPRPTSRGSFGYDPIPTIYGMLGMHRAQLEDKRDFLLGRLAVASVALCPFRVDAKTAIMIFECENGSYVERIKAGYNKLQKEGE